MNSPDIRVSADAQREGDQVVWIGAAEVRFTLPDGRVESAFFEFGSRPFPTRTEAEAYAREEALVRVQRTASFETVNRGA